MRSSLRQFESGLTVQDWALELVHEKCHHYSGTLMFTSSL